MSTKKKKNKNEVVKIDQTLHLYGYIIGDELELEYGMAFFTSLPSRANDRLRDEISNDDNDFPVNITLYDLTSMVKKRYKIDNLITIKEILD